MQINPLGTEIKILQVSLNTTAADILAPCIIKSPAAATAINM